MSRLEVELPEDFLEAVAVRAAEIIEARRSHWLYGDKAAAEYLGWPVGRVTKLRQRGELPARALHSELKTAIREGGGEIVVGDNSIRQEIFDCLDAVEAERGSLTDRESALREALREPFTARFKTD